MYFYDVVADFQEWLVGALNLRTIGNIMATKHIYLMIDGYYLVPSQVTFIYEANTCHVTLISIYLS